MIFFILAFAICRIRFQYSLWYGGLCNDKNNYSKTSEYEFFVVIIAPSRFACFVVLNFMFIRLLFTCIVKHLQFSFVFSISKSFHGFPMHTILTRSRPVYQVINLAIETCLFRYSLLLFFCVCWALAVSLLCIGNFFGFFSKLFFAFPFNFNI